MARRFWDNPVARHAGRLSARTGRVWAVVPLLVGIGAVALLFQRFWLALPDYSFLRPDFAVGLFALGLLAETLVALPCAAVRGALVWRRLRTDGHLEEYRRSRMSAWAITFGALAAALGPAAALLACSLGLALAGSALDRSLPAAQVIVVHLLLALQCLAFAALGLRLAGSIRVPGLAIPISLAVLALAVGAVALIDPFYRAMHHQGAWIYAALLPNPVTAVGAALGDDVLRFAWTYEHLHANEYFYQYPPAWQSGGLYLLVAALLLALTAKRVARAG